MITMSMALRNRRLQAIVDELDKGRGAASLKLYGGKRPRNGGPAGQLLADIGLSKPCGKVVNGTLVLARFDQAVGLEMGHATWARFESGAGEQVMDGSVGIEGADVLMIGATAIATGQPVEIESAVFTEPGA